MSSNRLEALRAHFKKAEEEKDTRERSKVSYYPFFKMDFGQEAIIRFLPDKNTTNPEGFLIAEATHTLTVNGNKTKVPCLKNYGHKTCPICEVSREFYKREGKDSAQGKKYWRDMQYLARVVVVSDPLPVESGKESNAGKVRIIGLTKQIYDKITAALTSTSDPLPEMPDDLNNGTNFIIRKERQGEYASYSNSGFARSSTPVPIEIDSDRYLIDLRTLLRAEPTLDIVEAMLKADLTGEPYDDGSSAYRRATSGMAMLLNKRTEAATTSTSQADVPTTRLAETPSSVASVATGSETSSSDEDFMLELRRRAENRKKQAGLEG